MGKISSVITFAILISLAYGFYKLFNTPPIPTIEEKWWGAENSIQDTSVHPFKINVSNEVISDLKNRLKNALPFQESLEDAKQHYGINSNLLNSIADYWKTKYDWNKRQEFLNQFPQFKTNIQGLNIHFLHVKPQNVPKSVEVLPLLILHGWPGSVREFYEILPILTTPQTGRDFVFEVIAPSLPGYGFSDGPTKQGLGPAGMALIMDKLMKRLHFNTYYIQGGDWGSVIGSDMSILFADHIKGAHFNMCSANSLASRLKLLLGALWPSLIAEQHEIEWNYPLSSKYSFLLLETGYLHLQATKPDTIGTALRDSPVGLAAYILEKFTTLTNPAWKDLEDGGLTKKFTLDKLLDNVMIYWVTRSITTSVRLYAENFNAARQASGLDSLPLTIPSSCSRFRHEFFQLPKSVLKTKYKNLIHVADHDDGGHFAAFELPDVLAKDIFDFVQKVREVPQTKKEL